MFWERAEENKGSTEPGTAPRRGYASKTTAISANRAPLSRSEGPSLHHGAGSSPIRPRAPHLPFLVHGTTSIAASPAATPPRSRASGSSRGLQAALKHASKPLSHLGRRRLATTRRFPTPMRESCQPPGSGEREQFTSKAQCCKKRGTSRSGLPK